MSSKQRRPPAQLACPLLTAPQIMQPNPILLRQDMTCHDAARVFLDHDMTCGPVVRT